MELVKVDRVYVERTSRKCIVILGGPRLECGLGSSYRRRKAVVFALEAHG